MPEIDALRPATRERRPSGNAAPLCIEQHVRVDFSYPVCFTSGLFAPESTLLRDVICTNAATRRRRLLFVLDGGVVGHHPGLPNAIEAYCRRNTDVLDLVRPPLVTDGGEHAKNGPDAIARIQRTIHEHGICRHSYVVAVGGGALLDMTGFAAATAHRGVRLVRVPTTVLAQNDSAVGVKNGVNAYGQKNFLGTFTPPQAVLIDFDFLTTLPDRDWRGGIAEAVKVGLVKDPEFFGFIEANAHGLRARDMEAMRYVVTRCAELHLDHIATSGDPFELGSSRPLDFGHWAAHKLECLSGWRLRHGEAVSVGIALDVTYAHLAGLLGRAAWERILDLLRALGLPTYAPELRLEAGATNVRRCFLDGLDEFREHLGGELTIMLLEGIGRGVEVHEVDEAKLVESVAVLEAREGAADMKGARWQPAPAR
jgi:3-dehydroquinate synthase